MDDCANVLMMQMLAIHADYARFRWLLEVVLPGNAFGFKGPPIPSFLVVVLVHAWIGFVTASVYVGFC